MNLDDITAYLPLLSFAFGLITAVIAGLKYVNKRWSKTLDSRIDGCISQNIKPTCVELDNHENRIKSLEDRFKDFKDFFIKSK